MAGVEKQIADFEKQLGIKNVTTIGIYRMPILSKIIIKIENRREYGIFRPNF